MTSVKINHQLIHIDMKISTIGCILGCITWCIFLQQYRPHPHGHWQLQELLGNYYIWRWWCIFLQQYRIHMDIGNSKNFLGINIDMKTSTIGCILGCIIWCIFLQQYRPHPHGHWQLQELLGNQYRYENIHYRLYPLSHKNADIVAYLTHDSQSNALHTLPPASPAICCGKRQKWCTVGPVNMESLGGKKRVSTGALRALDDPSEIQTKIWKSGWVPVDNH